jgi:hypothetical protein
MGLHSELETPTLMDFNRPIIQLIRFINKNNAVLQSTQ